jgi:hypothetical protein
VGQTVGETQVLRAAYLSFRGLEWLVGGATLRRNRESK